MEDKLKTELRIRGYSKKTVEAYSFHVKRFLRTIKKKSGNLKEDDIKQYVAHLYDKEQKPKSINLALSALRFYYAHILKIPLTGVVQTIKVPKKIPIFSISSIVPQNFFSHFIFLFVIKIRVINNLLAHIMLFKYF